MRQLLGWLGRRLYCVVAGHDMHTGEFYYPPAKSIQTGYVCERCGHCQLLLRRWQSVSDADAADQEGDTDT